MIFDANFNPITLKNHWKFICFTIVFAKSAFRSWHRFLIRSWCQHASILPPKTHQKCIKTRTWKASIFWWIFAWVLYRFSFDLGSQLGAMLASKTRPRRLQEASKMAPKTKCVTFFAPAVILINAWYLTSFWSVFWLFLNHFLPRFSIDFNT